MERLERLERWIERNVTNYNNRHKQRKTHTHIHINKDK